MFQTPLLMKKLNVTYPGQMVIKNTSQEIQGDWQHAGGKDVGCGSQIYFFFHLSHSYYLCQVHKNLLFRKTNFKAFYTVEFLLLPHRKAKLFFSEGFIIAL